MDELTSGIKETIVPSYIVLVNSNLYGWLNFTKVKVKTKPPKGFMYNLTVPYRGI